MTQGVRHIEIDGLTWVRKNSYKVSDGTTAIRSLHDAGARDIHILNTHLYGRCVLIVAEVNGKEIFVELKE